jgi:hypothetical protein
MKHLKHPATIVAALALFVALAGGAGASVLMSGSHLKNHSVAEKKLTKRAITALRGQRGARGPAGPQGAAGPKGPAGTALAYAHISSTGTLDATKSSGVAAANYTHNGPGEYCFKGLTFTPHNVVATIDAAGAATLAGTSAHVAVGTSSYCPTGTQVAVVTTNAAALSNYGVYITFN